jgi:hypothetical protein
MSAIINFNNDKIIEHVCNVVRGTDKEYSIDVSGSRNISWKHSQYSAQRFEDALSLLALGPKIANFRTQINLDD